ncbi:alpha/beta fold hydrolase [Pseudothermotoga thermarum]|uniref:alpha/beta fold hydrolase n=1 Tax=Pseudothermotoga thermarum TaxID=119394 RepID=UPI00247AFC1F|nr:alpha/beta hydrolase [Pseudothermotoga thermarum]
MDQMNLKKVVVIGHSLGGAVAMLFALKYPEMVEKLILVAPCPVDGLPTPTENLPYLALYKTSRTLLKRSIRGLLPTLKDKKFLEALADDALKMNPDSIYPHVEELGKFNVVDLVKNNFVPTIIVFGDMDPLLTYSQMEKTAKTLGAKLAVLNGVGHTPFVEKTDLFVQIIEDFLGGA